MPFTVEQVLNFGITALLIFLVWQIVRPRWTVCIVAGPDEIKILRGVAVGQQARLKAFLREDVALSTQITILASKSSYGRLRTRIKGSIDDGLRQRIRNYLLQIL